MNNLDNCKQKYLQKHIHKKAAKYLSGNITYFPVTRSVVVHCQMTVLCIHVCKQFFHK